MSGAPARPTRAAFGPIQVVANRSVVSTDRELSPSVGKLMLWQLSALGLAGPASWAEIDYAAGYTVGRYGSVARPDSQLTAKPTVTRTSAGVLSVEYPASMPDQDGAEVLTDFVGALAIPQAIVRMSHAQQVDTSGRRIDVRFWDASDVAVDSSFFLVVW